jgi:hypothetical protein
MAEGLHDKFVSTLSLKYGDRNELTSKFGTTSYGEIAKDLCISGSQFSKLISGTATEGMYLRSIENIELLIRMDELVSRNDELEQKAVGVADQWSAKESLINRQWQKTILWLGVIAAGLGALLTYSLLMKSNVEANDLLNTGIDHPLSLYFDRDFQSVADSPYLDEDDVHALCPCSGFEGTWALAESYKLPLPGNKRPGVYYFARKADVRMKCKRSISKKETSGSILTGYEHLINEIWIDTEAEPLSPEYFDMDSKQFTKAYEALDVTVEPKFQKLADIHSFFLSSFLVENDRITRKGEPVGRFAENVDWDLANKYKVDPKHILENVLSDLTVTSCNTSENPFCDPNDLEEGKSIFGFDCYYTIANENLGIGAGYPYLKSYKLVSQNYSDNLLCGCSD